MLDLAILGFNFLPFEFGSAAMASCQHPRVKTRNRWVAMPGLDASWQISGQHWVELRPPSHPGLEHKSWEKNRISATKRMQIYAGAGVRGISVCPTPLPSEPKGNVAMRDNASWAASSRPKISRMTRWYLYRMPITSDLLLMTVGSCGPAVKNDQLLNSGDLLPKHATVRGLLDPSL